MSATCHKDKKLPKKTLICSKCRKIKNCTGVSSTIDNLLKDHAALSKIKIRKYEVKMNEYIEQREKKKQEDISFIDNTLNQLETETQRCCDQLQDSLKQLKSLADHIKKEFEIEFSTPIDQEQLLCPSKIRTEKENDPPLENLMQNFRCESSLLKEKIKKVRSTIENIQENDKFCLGNFTPGVAEESNFLGQVYDFLGYSDNMNESPRWIYQEIKQ